MLLLFPRDFCFLLVAAVFGFLLLPLVRLLLDFAFEVFLVDIFEDLVRDDRRDFEDPLSSSSLSVVAGTSTVEVIGGQGV